MKKVKEYIKNVGRSTAYLAADILGEQYSTIKEFTTTNSEVMKEGYSAIKDYRTTFAKVKKTITESDIYVAAGLTFNSIVEDIKTGNFYNKERESRILDKFGGSGMDTTEWDMDDEDFQWDDNADISAGDKVIAVAIKKNRIFSAMTTEAIASGNKAIVDSSRENTSLLYVQQERMMSKLDGHLGGITQLLKNNNEMVSKMQSKHFENAAKFMTNMERKTDTIVAQLDEMIQMQRNLYAAADKKEKERKANTVTDVARNGIPDIKLYAEQIKNNIFDTINNAAGGALSMGNALGGGNIFATFAANPIKDALEEVFKKGISKEFKNASRNLNNSLKGYFTSFISKANSARTSEDGLARFLGNVLGLKVDKEASSVSTDKYTKGPVPFDGVTKKAITEVIPFYLRKMTSMITGEDEKVFDYNSGRWTTVRSIQKSHSEWLDRGYKDATANIKALLKDIYGRDTSRMMSTKLSQERFEEQLNRILRVLYENNGDFNALNRGLEYGLDEDLVNELKNALYNDDNQYAYTTKLKGSTKNAKSVKVGIDRTKYNNGVRTGLNKRSIIANFANDIFETKSRRAEEMRKMEREDNSLIRMLYAEGIVGDPTKSDKVSGIINKYGDYNKNKAFKSPLANALVYVPDNYGYTLFDYLRYMKSDLTAIRNNGRFSLLGGRSGKADTSNTMKFEDKNYRVDWEVHDYSGKLTGQGPGYREYMKNKRREEQSYDERYAREYNKWVEKGKTDLEPLNITSIEDLHKIRSRQTTKLELDSIKESNRKNDERKTVFTTLYNMGLISKEEMKTYNQVEADSDKPFSQQLKATQGAMKKFALINDYVKKLSKKPWEAATDSIVKMDLWLSRLFFEEDFKIRGENYEEKGLMGMMKEKFKESFENLTEKLSNILDKAVTKFNEKYGDRLDKIKGYIFGTKDADNVYSGGIFGNMIGGVQRALNKNAEDVKAMAKKTVNKITGKDDSESGGSSNSNSNSSVNPNAPDNEDTKYLYNHLVKKTKILTNKEFTEYIKYCKDHKFSPTDATRQDNINAFLLSIHKGQKIRTTVSHEGKVNIERDQVSKVSFKDLNSLIRYCAKNLFDGDKERATKYVQWADENFKFGDDYYRYIVDTPINSFFVFERLQKDKENTKKKRENYKENDLLEAYKNAKKNVKDRVHGEELEEDLLEAFKNAKKKLKEDKEHDEELEENTEVLNQILSPIKDIAGSLKELAQFLRNISDPFGNIINGNNNNPEMMAKGGINVGKPFISAVSSGEIVNGNVVPPGGPYFTKIPTGGIVINPASKSVRARQAAQEKAFIRNNAEPGSDDSGLKKLSGFFDNQKNADHFGNVVVRGGAGLGIGALLGGPFIGAGIGVASAFAKRSGGFADMLFGTTSVIDENGNVKGRNDDGLISAEIQKAFPDVAKGGLIGSLAGLITPFGPVGGLLIGSAMGFAKNNNLVQDVLFGDSGLFNPEKKEKLKKALPAMGLGAAGTALLGPFGLIGNALLGAAGGYVVTSDKFKDAVLGEMGQDGKRTGGIVGTLKSHLEPVKRFGHKLGVNVVDAIFGKPKSTGEKDENGVDIKKREGGIFGMIKDSIITPLAKGVAPVIQEFKIQFRNIAGKVNDVIEGIANGNGFLGERLLNTGGVLGKAAVGIAKGAVAIKTLPLTIGAKTFQYASNKLRESQIRRGEADDMTAEERIAFSNLHSMPGYAGRESDHAIATLAKEHSVDEIKQLQRKISFYTDQKNAEKNERHKIDMELKKRLSNTLVGTNKGIFGFGKGVSTESILKALQNKRYDEVDDMLNGRIIGKDGNEITDQERSKLKGLVEKYMEDTQSLSDEYKKLESGKYSVDAIQKELEEKGLNVNIKDKKSVEKFNRLLDTERVRKEAGVPVQSKEEKAIVKNTDVLTKASEQLDDLIRIMCGNTDEVCAKYGLKTPAQLISSIAKDADEEQKLKEEYQNITEPEERLKFIKNLEAKDKEKSAAKAEKEKKNAAFETTKALVRQASEEWNARAEKVRKEDNSGSFTDEDGVVYSWNDEKSEKEARKAFIKKYVASNGNEEIAREVVESGGKKLDSLIDRLQFKWNKNKGKIIKTALLSAIIPGGIAGVAAVGGVLALNKKFGIAKGIKKKAKNIFGNYAATDEDLREKANRARNNLSAEEKDKYLAEYLGSHPGANISDAMAAWEEEEYNRLVEDRSHGGQRRGLLGRISNGVSGVKNRIVAAIGKKKEERTGIDKIIGAIHDLPEAIKDKIGANEEKANPIKKWAKFIFGVSKVAVGVPIMVGFLNETVMPFIKNKVGPFLFGKKNADGEYEGGLISGIVNPIKTFFSNKFKRVHDWFFNKGDYSDPNKGSSAIWLNIKNGFHYGFELWKSGMSTILGGIGGIVEKSVSKLIGSLPEIAGGLIGGILEGVKLLLTSRNKKKVGFNRWNMGAGADSISKNNDSNTVSISSKADTIPFYDTFGGVISNSSSSIDSYKNYSSTSPIDQALSSVRAFASSAVKSGQSANDSDSVSRSKTVSISSSDVVQGGTDIYGNPIYYSKNDKSHLNPLMLNSQGQYVQGKDISEHYDSNLSNNKYWNEMHQNEMDGDTDEGYVSTFGTRLVKNLLGGGVYKSGRRAMGKFIGGAGKILKRIPVLKGPGKILNVAGGALRLDKKSLPNFLQNLKNARAAKKAKPSIFKKIANGISKGADNLKFLKEYAEEFGLKQTMKDVAEDAGRISKNKFKNITDKLANGFEFVKNKGAGIKLAKEAFEGAIKEKGLSTVLKEAAESGGKKVLDKVKSGKAAEKVGSIVKAIKSVINHVLASKPGRAILKKLGKEGLADGAQEAIERAAKEIGEKAIEKGSKGLLKNITAKLTPVGLAFIVSDFLTGMDDCRNILGVIDEDVSAADRFIAGLSKMLSGFLVVIPESTIANILLKTLGQIFFKNKSDQILKRQKEAEEALKAWNAEHGTDLTLEEYNNKYNKTFMGKVKEEAKKALKNPIKSGAIFGLGGWLGVKAFNFFKNKKNENTETEPKSNANADDGLENIDINGLGYTGAINNVIGNSITGTLDKSISGMRGFKSLINRFKNRNKSKEDQIDHGEIDPSSEKYWQIDRANTGNALMDSLLKAKEYITRLVKAPFSMVSETMSNINNIIGNESETTSNGSEKRTTKAKNIWGNIKDKFKAIFGKGSEDRKDDSEYGRGSDHIYQRDYNDSYQTSGDTERQSLADSGCGPAAAATVLNRYGENGDMRKAAKYALNNGFKEVNGGTYPEYFDSYLNKNGITTNHTNSNTEVVNSLVNGKPVILMGKDSNNNGKTPYGSKYSHYVVATGIDRNGNVIVEDSEDKRGQTKYSLADTLKNTSVKITTGAGRYGRGEDNFTSVFANYSQSMMKGIYGPYYSALFGNSDSSSSSHNNNSSGSYSYTSNVNLGDTSTIDARKAAMWKFFKSKGYSDNLTAGIMGNIECESAHSYHPNILEGENSSNAGATGNTVTWCAHKDGFEGGYTGYGICQWTHNYGHAALYNWCKAHNLSPDSLEGQMNYIDASIRGIDVEAAVNPSDPGGFGVDGSGVLGYLNDCFNKEGGFEVINNLSLKDATDIWLRLYERPYGNHTDQLNNRYNYAKAIYNEFAGSGSGKGIRSNGRSAIKRTANRRPSSSAYGYKKYRRHNSFINVYRPKYGRATEEDINETTTNTSSSSTTTNDLGNEGDSLLTRIGSFSASMMKGIYGPYWEALFGNTDTGDENLTGNSGTEAPYTVNDFNGKIVAPFKGKFSCSCIYDLYAADGIHPNGHNGVDLISCEDGSDESWTIYSLSDGVVTYVNTGVAPNSGHSNSTEGGGFGNWVEITSTDNVVFQYCHLNYVNESIQVGVQVHIGTVIGIGGHTGRSTGRHLHFGMYKVDGSGTKQYMNPSTAIMGFTDTMPIKEDEVYVSQLFADSESANGRGRSGRGNTSLTQKENRRFKEVFGSEAKIRAAIRRNNSTPSVLIQNGMYADPLQGINNGRGKSTRQELTGIKANRNGSTSIVSKRNDNVYVNTGTGRAKMFNPKTGQYDIDVEIPQNTQQNTLDTNTLLAVLQVIADNSAKTDQIIQLLAAIVTNTNVDTTKSSQNSTLATLISQLRNGSSSSTASTMGLNQLLNNNGTNVAQAVYSIARQ